MCPLWAPDNRWHKCHLYVEQKHNRAKPMSESASALFSIADAGEFRFARFYIVCEEVPLGTPESPLIVCGSSDTLCECPNVEEIRNGMPAVAWKKYMNFASKNLPPSVLFRNFRFSGNLTISRSPLFLILMEEAADQTVVVLWLHKAEPDVLVIQERKRRTVADHHFLPDSAVKQIL